MSQSALARPIKLTMTLAEYKPNSKQRTVFVLITLLIKSYIDIKYMKSQR